MIGIVVAVVVAIVIGSIAWKLIPWIVDRLGVVDGLSIVNKVMIFFCFIFALFLVWVGMPAFVGTVKFFLFGRSFADLFRWGIFNDYAKLIGDIMLNAVAFALFLAVNFAELYPRIVRGNREALEKILTRRRAAKQRTSLDPDDDIQERMIKHQIRTSGVFSMVDAYIICGVGFVLDTAIAVCNNPAIQNNAVLTKLVRLGAVGGSTTQQLVILGLMV
uniref:hypothetical protein n=1 Tax=Chamaesiphon sp. TaxID=2814140 RepID=UPI003593E33D